MDKNVSLETLLAAPKNIEINGNTYSLQAYLWRNLMPGEDTKDGLQALVQLVAEGQESFPSEVNAIYLWVIKEQEVWQTEFLTEERTAPEKNQLEKLAVGGPNWTGEVTVVVEIYTTNNDKYLLQSPNQKIHKVF
ncbi:MAG: hypothetical protein IPK14_15305 [Blastocatellia bacterium]|nr:hypothetical protein [Blastocatellia bacterium]